MKILKHIILFIMLILLVGVVSAENVSDDASTCDFSESEQDSGVPSSDTLTAQTDESKLNNIEKTNTGNLIIEDTTVTSWNKLVDKVDSLRNTTEDVTITLDEGTFTNNGTIYWESENPIVLTIDGNGQKIDGNKQQLFYISGESSLVLTNIIIENASSEYGGAIYNYGSLTIINSTFTHNTGSMGGAICAEGPLTVNNSNFMDNSAEYGGAIYKDETLTINNSTFTHNTGSMGGAICAEGPLTVNNSNFMDNSAKSGGTITVYDNVKNISIVNSYFSENTANYAGAIEIYDKYQRNNEDVFIDGNIFTDNSAMTCGALYVAHSALITNNLFTNNRITNDSNNGGAGAIFLESYNEEITVNLINNTFCDNTVENGGFGGAVYARGFLFLNSYNDTFISNVVESYGYGGAICAQESALVNISNGTFKNNRATWGGAILCESMLDVTDSEFLKNCAEYGGAIISWNAKITVRNSKFKDLYANRSGGAIGIKYDFEFDTSISGMTSKDEGLNLSEVIIENCEFRNVSSKNNGGAICLSDLQEYPDCIFVTMRVNNSTFRDCKSEFGGAILKLNGNLTINNSEFDGISAYESGGAIYTSHANLDIMNSSFTDYTANTDGKLIYLDMGVLSIIDSVFYDDEAVSEKSSSIYVYDSSMYLTDSYFNNPESSIYGVFVNDYIIENTTLHEDRINLNNTDYITATTYKGKKLEIINYTPVYDIPSSYDLRDYGLVTAVKNQMNLGACLAFAGIAAIESALLKQTNTEYDLSENNIHSTILKYSRYGSAISNEGALNYEIIGNTLNWIGVIPEKYDEYDSLGTISKIVDTNDKIRVHDVMIIFFDTPDKDKLIKESILNYGAVMGTLDETLSDEYWNPETNSLYNPDSEYSNHAVAIVGWDDNYSKENFIITPPGDGAWILKNSHGSNMFDNGYYYMSYYDNSFLRNDEELNFEQPATVYIFNNTINYKTNYQTDIRGLSDFNSSYTYYSNTYTAYYNESLAAVGTYFNESGIAYEFKIYINDKHVLTQNGTSNYAGYKTIMLNKYIPVKEGDTFKVVFKNNNLPYQDYSRQHYLKNISFISTDGKNWKDISENNQTVCLKVYTVETEENDTNDTPTPQPKPVPPQPKPVPPQPKSITPKHGTINDTTTHENNGITQRTVHTIRLANDNTMVYTGNALTLEALNRIFDLNFTNGHLLVYMDGVLVFNDTTTDDITMIILELLDKYLGEHEIKVVFNDCENHTDTYKENVIIG